MCRVVHIALATLFAVANYVNKNLYWHIPMTSRIVQEVHHKITLHRVTTAIIFSYANEDYATIHKKNTKNKKRHALRQGRKCTDCAAYLRGS